MLGVSCGVFPFTYAAQFPLHGIFSSPAQIPLAEPVYQASEFQQVHHAEWRTVSTHGDLRINSDDVSPLRRNGANGFIIDLQQQGDSIAVVPLAYAGQLPSAERMKRMRDAHKARGCDRSICILN